MSGPSEANTSSEMINPGSKDWLKRALGLADSQSPFPWQIELLERFLRGDKIEALDIPTGLGKTATMAIWLVARALGANLPRRLVYVVDRRAVVDQASEIAKNLQDWVAREHGVSAALGIIDKKPLPISTLRGQHVDNRAWLEDPSSPAIIVGTIDMVGSRLLFSGYGVSSKMRPYHAGLLGADTLVVLDEAHLAPSFEDLLRQIERGADSLGPREPSLRRLIPEFKLLSLSATGRQTNAATLTLSDADRSNPIVKMRLAAKKSLSIIELASMNDYKNSDANAEATKANKGPKLVGVLAEKAWEVTRQGSDSVRCLVYCDARKDTTAVAAELRKLAKSASAPEPIIELFVGGRRVKERTQARDALARLGFIAGTAVYLERSVFLIATSAGEVGVDLDADHMVCDLVPWERMVQRLGRVNRRGDGDAKVIVVVEGEPAPPSAKAQEALDQKIAKRDAALWAFERRAELQSEIEKLEAAKEKLKVAQKDRKARIEEEATKPLSQMKKALKDCKDKIKAFKDSDAKAVAQHEAEVAMHRALKTLLAIVADGNGSLSPDALLRLRDRQDLTHTLRTATSVEPLRPDLTRALVDAWSMTSLDEHAGRPEVDPWLRGFRPNDPPQTTVVWRRHLPVGADGSLCAKSARLFFEAAPPHSSEQLETETHVVLNWLIERAVAISAVTSADGGALLDANQVVVVALGRRGEPKGWRTLSELSAVKGKDRNTNSKAAKTAGNHAEKELEQLLAGATLVIDARLGGLADGILDEKEHTTAGAADDSSTTWIAHPDIADVPVTGFRIRVVGANDEAESAWRKTPGAGWVQRHMFVTKVLNGEPSAALVIDGRAVDATSGEDRATADRLQPLDEHQRWAEDCARQIAQRLRIGDKWTELLALSARLHDEGKRATQWQNAFAAPTDGRPYAKTNGPINFDLLDDYRHELGSLPYIEAHDEFKALGSNDQEFVLHLVAAHHGYARPVIGVKGRDLPPPSLTDEWALHVALRFARLTARWGPWGLAWWEALLRSADQIASRRNEQIALEQTEQPR